MDNFLVKPIIKIYSNSYTNVDLLPNYYIFLCTTVHFIQYI